MFPPKYHNPAERLVKEMKHEDGKHEKLYENGKVEIILGNGVRKEEWPDGY